MDYKKLHKDTINRLQQMVSCGKITVEVARGICADFIPESEDERIRKEIKDFFSRIMLGQENFLREDYDWNAWIAWIEKQYKKDEKIILLKDKIESLESARIAMQECHRLELEKLEKQGEQKPADKVEPKFHEGEWVVTDKNNVVQIKAIEDSKYVLENTMRFSVDYIDKCWRKWTIQDAKDGDVLADDRAILLFRSIGNRNWKNVISYYAILETNLNNRFSISDNEEYWGKIEDCELKPASKEQRDTLERAMTNYGYKWNADQKKLEKIEQKPADVRTIGYWHVEDIKQEWSEEDERIVTELIGIFESAVDGGHVAFPYRLVKDYIRVLKLCLPQNTWKPSDEQMEVLARCKPLFVEPKSKGILESLINDLKKLMEE